MSSQAGSRCHEDSDIFFFWKVIFLFLEDLGSLWAQAPVTLPSVWVPEWVDSCPGQIPLLLTVPALGRSLQGPDYGQQCWTT